MSRFAHTKPAAMKPPSLIATVVLLLATLLALGAGGFMAYKSLTVVTQWDKAQGKIVSIEETKTVDKYGNTKANYRPIFEVTPAGGAPVKARSSYAYNKMSGIEVGSTLTVRYKEGEAMLDTVGSLYVMPVVVLGIGVFLALMFHVYNKSRMIALEHNKKHGY